MVDETLTQPIVSNLLGSAPDGEETIHPWGSNFSFNPDLPLLRAWDECSGSIPSESGTMLARLYRGRLDTRKARGEFLAIHAKHRLWEKTPFISFTQSSQGLEKLFRYRNGRNRGDQNIVVVNPNIRKKKGLPILDMEAEMRYYGISDPYCQSGEYYKNHCVCLWEVTEEEIVGIWTWEDLCKTDRWYEQIILPAFRNHNDRYSDSVLDMSTLESVILDLCEALSNASEACYRFSESLQSCTEAHRGSSERPQGSSSETEGYEDSPGDDSDSDSYDEGEREQRTR